MEACGPFRASNSFAWPSCFPAESPQNFSMRNLMRSAMEACACMESWSLPWPVGSPRAFSTYAMRSSKVPWLADTDFA